MLKNKIIISMIAILLIGCGLFSNIKNQMPEDKELSSGNSAISMSRNSYISKFAEIPLNKDEINNFLNVVNYKYNTAFLQRRNMRLTDVSFNFWEDVLFSNDMYLQGICFTEKYLLVSSYYAEPNVLGKVMVFDKDTGEYILSLGLDSESHLGGIAFDGKNVWVCNSSKLAIERIPYKFICNEAVQNRGKLIDVRMLVEKYPVNLIPSCITYYDDHLWIATHTKLSNSKMISYSYDEQGELSVEKTYHLPSKVQGIAFDDNGQVILSTSYGRKNSSYLRFYRSVEAMSRNIDEYEKAIEMPPCSEGIAIENQHIYLLFESAGEKYREGTDGKGKCIAPLDKILIIDPA